MDRTAIINKSIDYILAHLSDSITIDDVASHLGFSKYHFSRIFKEVTGESVYAFIKRQRVEQSAIDIKLQKEKLLTDIGLDYGYSSSNYSSLFKDLYHLSPAQYRKNTYVTARSNPFCEQRIETFGSYEYYQQQIQICKIKDLYVLYERTLGNYIDIKTNWQTFLEKNSDNYNDKTVMIEKFFNDPSVSTYYNSICDLCITIDETISADNTMIIKGGQFAVFPFEGAIQDIFGTLQGCFTIWLPNSPHTMSENYALNIYHKVNFDTNFVAMDLYIPIK